MDVLNVASHSSPHSASGAVAGALEHDGVVELHAIGAGAVNQTVKAIAVARRLVERPGDRPLRVVPGFIVLVINGESRTGMRFVVER